MLFKPQANTGTMVGGYTLPVETLELDIRYMSNNH